MRRFLYLPLSLILAAAGCGNGSQGAFWEQGDAPRVARTDLQSAVSDDRLRAFYESRGWTAVWTDRLEEQLLGVIRGIRAHGIDPRPLIEAVEGKSGAAREAALTEVAHALAAALADGQVDPTAIWEIYTIARPQIDVSAQLNGAVERGEVAAWLNGLAPSDPEYRALSEAYLHAVGQLGQSGPKVAGGPAIEEGDVDPRVPVVRLLLVAQGYLAEPAQPATGGANGAYTPDMVAAVRAMQQDQGLEPDGIVGPDTVEALNRGPEDRVRQLAANLERRRWLARTPAATRIDVNTASAVLDFWHDGNHADRRRVIVGQPGWETPQLASPIFRLVANPTWTVPKSIEEEEIAPKGAAYLRRNNMVRRDGWIVQLPGPDNALGLVKFDMRNDHAIYLHDTPAKPLFGEAQRHFSHGCVRVQDALGFARRIAELDGKLQTFDAASARGEETFVKLDREIPVRLLYHTVFLGEDGRLAYRPDVYGWDDMLARKLGLGEARVRAPVTHVGDIGP